MKTFIKYISLLILSFTTLNCVEEFDAGTVEFEDAIVIEASITNEFKFHHILLSRTYKFEENGPIPESGATVSITVSNGNSILFTEFEPGVYRSTVEFSGEPAVSYQLFVSTNDGRAFTSNPTELTHESVIDDVYALRATDDDGVEGIGIYVDSFDPTNSSKYYGYEFDETYQIIAPFWTAHEIILLSDQPPYQFDVQLRTQEERVCYNTINSKGKLLASTNLLSEDRVSKFLVKFVPLDDFKLNSRYSLLVRQFIQSAQAYNYHKTFNEFLGGGSLFSQIQPGFLNGNVFSVNNEDEKVLGFFEVSSIDEKRVFFDRSEFIEDAYPWGCEITDPDPSQLASWLRNDRVTFIFERPEDAPGGPFDVVRRACGDCTASGSNIRPSFWID